MEKQELKAMKLGKRELEGSLQLVIVFHQGLLLFGWLSLSLYSQKDREKFQNGEKVDSQQEQLEEGTI